MSRHRCRRRRPREPRVELEWITELWEMAPAPSELHRHYTDARRGVRGSRQHIGFSVYELSRGQAYLRRVQTEFLRRLACNWIYVEGA